MVGRKLYARFMQTFSFYEKVDRACETRTFARASKKKLKVYQFQRENLAGILIWWFGELSEHHQI